MLTDIHPKLPMRNKAITKEYYSKLGFQPISSIDYDGYLMLRKDHVEIHFFEFKALKPSENYGQIYIRTDGIDELYERFISHNIPIHPNGPLVVKPWGQKEFALLDPDKNLLTFGERI